MSELVSLARTYLERSQAKEPDWLTAWRELAALTYGIPGDDPRFPVVMDVLNVCPRLSQRELAGV